jgi:membrane fusion protein (multidrug efflux system)
MATQTSAPLHLASADAPAAGTAVPVSPPRRINALVVLGILALVAAAVGLRRFLIGLHQVTTDNAQVEGYITPISPKVAAFVAQVRVEDNQRVRPGDTLVVLDDRDFRERLKLAAAELSAARATIAGKDGGQARAQLAASQAAAAGAGSTVQSAEAASRKAQADLDRYRGLADRKIVSAQQLDAAQAAAEAAAANLDAARRLASAARSQVDAAAAGVRIAQARLGAAQSTVDNARLQLSYTVITAPVSGTVARRTVDVGALVQIGQGLMVVLPDDKVWVVANVKETELEDVTPGDSVSFTVDAYRDHTFHGHVESVSPATGARFALLPPDNATGNFTKVVQRVPVRIVVDDPVDPQHLLRPGMSVEVTIRTK